MSLRPPTPLDAGRNSGVDESGWAKVLAAALFLGVFTWLFWDVLFHAENLLFRDAAHFYYPLYKYVHEEWAAGRVPLWNPYENCGEPLHAQGVTAAFYPGKLVFFLPIGYDAALRVYILGHVLLCGWAAYFVARKFGRSVWAASLCALAYAYGGNVLFQIYNVVYLVGAAWLPLALWQAESMLRTRSYRNVVGLALVLAMMVLGGDPQAAYHSGLIACGYAVLLWRDDRRQRRQSSSASSADSTSATPRHGRLVRVARHRVVLLLAAAAAAFLLSAVQMIPTMELSRLSVRAAFDEPRSLYEIPEYVMREPLGSSLPSEDMRKEDKLKLELQQAPWYRALLAQGSPYEHEMQAYEFSVGPWRLAEFIWPNFGGKPFPEHRRWLEAIPQEQRMWVPSMYLGMVPFVFALCAWRIRRTPSDVGRVSRPVCSADRRDKRRESKDVATGSRISSAAKKNQDQTGLETRPTAESTDDLRIRWLSWTVMIFTLGGLGIFGLGWLTREVAALWSQDARDGAGWPVGDAFGGVYWFFTVTLPGYVQFRYPAKLLVPVSLGLSLLAAYGWDLCFSAPGDLNKHTRSWRRPQILLTVFLALSLCAAIALNIVSFDHWNSVVADVRASALFGPLNSESAWIDLVWTLGHAGVASLVVICCIGELCRFRRREFLRRRMLATTLLVITAFDLAISDAWMVVSAHESEWQLRSTLQPSNGSEDADRLDRPVVVFPSDWSHKSDINRLTDIVRWERNALMSKHALDQRMSVIDSPGTLDALDFQHLLGHARRDGFSSQGHPRVLDMLNVNILMNPASWPNTRQYDIGLRTDWEGFFNEYHLKLNQGAFPRAQLLWHVVAFGELKSTRPANIAQRTLEVLYDNSQPRSFRQLAIVESEFRGFAATFPPTGRVGDTADDVMDVRPDEVVVLCHSDRPGLLVLADRFYPGWKAYVETQDETGEVRAWEAPILRTNRVLRGVWLPEGQHKVTFRYEPWSFFVGAWLSGLAWAGLAVVVGVLAAKKRKRRNKHGKHP